MMQSHVLFVTQSVPLTSGILQARLRDKWIHKDSVQVMAAMWLYPGCKSINLGNRQLSEDITFSIAVGYDAITTAPGFLLMSTFF
ncbi:hypothetical protein Y032_0010g869 [Ancylostoma ceylanicum]|uniref:Uncharacterized protein n=1 Tax=Ancylostoma ceylanicum TaxID=53326 RepID=A0A016VGU1_9BILA|nr:hypothetical protein Y032_0010g869 [Ancylostoma ceylanicum]